MNFLAHLFLSGRDDEIILGNFIGDFVKGKKYLDYSKGIGNGILLHRAIDHYTDSHPVVGRSKKRLEKKYRHYSGVIVDIFYDHFLARNWLRFADVPLEKFASDCYKLVERNLHVLPEKALYVFPFMVKGNWLVNYSNIQGIRNTMRGMAKRTSHESKMEESVNDLEERYPEFEKDFLDFFPDITDFAEKLRRKN